MRKLHGNDTLVLEFEENLHIVERLPGFVGVDGFAVAYSALFEGFFEGEFLGVVVEVEVRVFGGEGGEWGGWVDLFGEALQEGEVKGDCDGFGLHLDGI
jgi:hypothetical protein